MEAFNGVGEICMISTKIADKLYLNCQTVTGTPASSGTNHFVGIDRSGSMYGVMGQMRDLFKNKIISLLGSDDDTLTLVAFSSRGDYSVICQGEKIRTLKDLKALHKKIDDELRATNLTGFVEPLREIARLAAELSSNGNASSLWFMSDGYENQWSRKEVLEAMRAASALMGSVTVVEFGDYADRALLSDMASAGGGEHIYTRDFDRYVPEMGKALRRRAGMGKIEVAVPGSVVGGFVYAVTDDALVSVSVEDGVAKVPSTLAEIAWLSDAPAGKDVGELGKKYLYAALSLYSARMQSEVVYPILKYLGDVRFVKDYSVCFGKQRYATFMESSKEAALGRGRYELGQDFNCVPPDDCFTIWDLLQKLSGSNSQLLLDKFEYKRVGAKTVSAADRLNRNESREIDHLQEEIESLNGRLAASKGSIEQMKELSAALQAAQGRINEILASKVEPPEFIPNDAGLVSVSGLVFNEERPNISVKVQRKGKVDLTGYKKFDLPDSLDTQEWKSYTIVKDGLLNVERLPVRVPTAVWVELAPHLSADVLGTSDGCVDAIIDLTKIPVMNRAMVKAASLDSFVELELRLAFARAKQKVLNHYVKEAGGGVSAGKLANQFGAEAAAYLKSLGVTDSGYSPKRVTESTDYYTGKFLSAVLYESGALAKLASGKSPTGKLDELPSVDKVAGSKTARGGKALMLEFLNYFDQKRTSGELTDDQLKQEKEAITKTVRELLLEKAKIVFTIIVGQTWFSGCVPKEIVFPGEKAKSLFGNKGTKVWGGQEYDYVVGQEERQIQI
jgi:hypothetical protein